MTHMDWNKLPRSHVATLACTDMTSSACIANLASQVRKAEVNVEDVTLGVAGCRTSIMVSQNGDLHVLIDVLLG